MMKRRMTKRIKNLQASLDFIIREEGRKNRILHDIQEKIDTISNLLLSDASLLNKDTKDKLKEKMK